MGEARRAERGSGRRGDETNSLSGDGEKRATQRDGAQRLRDERVVRMVESKRQELLIELESQDKESRTILESVETANGVGGRESHRFESQEEIQRSESQGD